MEPVILLDNTYATLRYLPDDKIIYHTFHQPIGGDEFRNVLMTGYHAMKKYGATKWLSDDRLNAALSPEDSAWAVNDWNALVLKVGWKFWAIVVPKDVHGRMNMNEFIQFNYEHGITVMVFTDLDEAMTWLKSKN